MRSSSVGDALQITGTNSSKIDLSIISNCFSFLLSAGGVFIKEFNSSNVSALSIKKLSYKKSKWLRWLIY